MSFLRTELNVATTFAAIAGQSKFEDKISRSIAIARKACESARYFMNRVPLSADEAAEIGSTLAMIENELAALEASVGRPTEHPARNSLRVEPLHNC